MFVTDDPPESCPECGRELSGVVESDSPGTFVSGDFCKAKSDDEPAYFRRWFFHV